MDRIGGNKPVRWYLREWRDHKQWSVRELARRMETSPGTVSKLETGAQAWDASWLARAAFTFGLDDPKRLLEHPDKPTPNDLLRDASPEQADAIKAFIAFTLNR